MSVACPEPHKWGVMKGVINASEGGFAAVHNVTGQASNPVRMEDKLKVLA